jgi:hypothetical protein
MRLLRSPSAYTCYAPVPETSKHVFCHISKVFKHTLKYGFSLDKTTKKPFMLYISFDSDCISKLARNAASGNPSYRAVHSFHVSVCHSVAAPSLGTQILHQVHDQN